MPLAYSDEKLNYVIQYANKHYPDVLYDEETEEPRLVDSSLIYVFIVSYDCVIANLPLNCTEENYKKNKIMQKCLKDLGLNSDAFWGFLVFLYFVIDQYKKNEKVPSVTTESELKRLGKFIYDKQESEAATIATRNFFKDDTVNISCTKPRAKVIFSLPRLKIEITDKYLLNVIAEILLSMDGERTKNYRIMIPYNNFKLSERASYYWILKTISNELIIGTPAQGNLFGKEIRLYLCILEFFRYFNCSKGDFVNKRNYVIIRRLFRDHKDFDFEAILGSLKLYLKPKTG